MFGILLRCRSFLALACLEFAMDDNYFALRYATSGGA